MSTLSRAGVYGLRRETANAKKASCPAPAARTWLRGTTKLRLIILPFQAFLRRLSTDPNKRRNCFTPDAKEYRHL
jgi:hypothetical protein